MSDISAYPFLYCNQQLKKLASMMHPYL